jgi:hypothetical protein
MLSHHDLAWWGVFLTVAGLILMLPVAIVANILTPKLKNWWAERSITSTQKRIEALEKHLADCLSKYGQLSDGEDSILKGIVALGMFGVFSLTMVVGIFLEVVTRNNFTAVPQNMSPFLLVEIKIQTIFILAVAFIFEYVIIGNIERFRQRGSHEVRKDLRKSIDKLRAKLAMKQSTGDSA